MTEFRLRILSFLVMIIFGPELAGSELEGRFVRLSFLKDTVVNGHRVYLGDIVSCTGDAELCSETGGIDISSSPAPGRSLNLGQNVVTRILEKEWPGVAVIFDGSDTTRIAGAHSEVRSEDVRQKLQAWINNRVDYANGVKLSVSKVVVPYGSGIRPSQTLVEFPDLEDVPFRQPEWLIRNMVGTRLTQFRFVNPRDPDDSQTAQGQAYFVLERMMPTASSLLSSGTVLEEKNIVMQWVPLRRGANDFVMTQDQIVGRKLRQVLPAGEPFSIRVLDTAHVVSRNQPVTMILKNGGLEIATRATTVDAGVKGQIVEVVNVVNKKRMRAKVIDEQTVEAVAF